MRKLISLFTVVAAMGVVEGRTVLNLSPTAAPRENAAAIQAAIDAASAAGGDTVVIPAGRYVTGGVFLKDNVTLHLSEGAVLLGSTNKADYVSFLKLMPADFDWRKEYPGARSDAQVSYLHAVVGAIGATNIAIEGRGVIDGQGELVCRFRTQTGDMRWRNLLFYRSSKIRVEDVTLRNAAFWTFYLKECVDVVVRGITVDGQVHWNNDGIDIDAKNVLIENCTIDALDDAICPKSDCPGFLPENIEVRNCRIASNCNFIKFGTSCRAGFKNCRIHHCTLVPCRVSTLHHHNAPHPLPNGFIQPYPGVTNTISGLAAIAIESPDGGRISDIHIHDIDFTAACVQTPVFIRLERRAARPDGGEGSIENVLIERLKGVSVSQIASSVTGVPGLKVKNVTIRDCDITVRGGGTLAASASPVPEEERRYPDPTMFDMHMLPAYGFYLRHADGVRFENVRLDYGPEGEERPAIVQDDCTGVTFSNCSFRDPAPLTRPADKDGVEWYDGVELAGRGCLEGKAFWETDDFYDRLPAGSSNEVPYGVWYHGKQASGMCFRFKTTSEKLRIRWSLRDEPPFYHMAPTGKDGIDVYVFENGAWRYRSYRPLGKKEFRAGENGTDVAVAPNTPVMIYLPLYNGVTAFRLGLDRNAKIEGLPIRASGIDRPVVFYGTSITQGACASRPGLAFAATACRRIDAPLVNLGFSGAGKMERKMVDIVGGIWSSCIVLDCIWNMSPEQVRERYEPFLRELVRLQPRVPIVLAPQSDVFGSGRFAEKNAWMKRVYWKLVAEGVENLVLMPEEGLYAADGEGSTDGVHPNDYGMMRHADAFEKILRVAFARAPELLKPRLTLKSGEVEIVVGPNAPKTVKFAAKELKHFLDGVLGAAVPVVGTASAGKTPIRLGADATGWATASFAQDEFRIAVTKQGVSIAGRDDPKADPERALKGNAWSQQYARSTLFGVYEFLERYAGVRMYFPGELGEIVPRRAKLSVPVTDFRMKPDMYGREYSYFTSGQWFEGEKRDAKSTGPLRWLNSYRLRMQTVHVPFCHGLCHRGYLPRFHKTHPEYFALKTDGTRDMNLNLRHSGQLCHSSKVWDEIYLDAKSYLSGEGPEVRGIVAPNGSHAWWYGCQAGKYVDIMPNDGMVRCQCANCAPLYDVGDPDNNYMDTMIWTRTAEVGRRLIREGIPGYVTQMAYQPYRRVPDVALPTNVLVMVAERGPWSMPFPDMVAREYAEIAAWAKKLGHRVAIWTYPCKYGQRNIPNIPNGTPWAWGHYYQGIAREVNHIFAESEGDRFMNQHVDRYVLGKLTWDRKVDVDALIEEYFYLMYGDAAPEMEAYFREIEKKWMTELLARGKDTEWGPSVDVQAPEDIWTKIYGSNVLAGYAKLFDAAVSKTAEGSLERRRVELMRRELFEPLAEAQREYVERQEKLKNVRFKFGDGAAISLIPDLRSKAKEIPEAERTIVTCRSSAEGLTVRIVCNEPKMAERATIERKDDDTDVWEDDGLELLVDPSGSRRETMHFMVSSRGCWADMIHRKQPDKKWSGDSKWNSGAKVTVTREDAAWVCEIAIPSSAFMGELADRFPADVFRSRNIKGRATEVSHWCPYTKSPCDFDNLGTWEK